MYRLASAINAPLKAGGQKTSTNVQFKQAVEFLDQGAAPNLAAYASLLRECGNRKSLVDGKRVHAHIMKSAVKWDVCLGNQLILMYNKCNSVVNARQVFDRMFARDIISWNSMIGGYSRNGHGVEALKLFHQMQQEGVTPNKITFISILNACVEPEAITLGKLIHAQIVEGRVEIDVVVGTSLVNMYGKCGSIHDARRMFHNMLERDLVLWNAMIGGYARHGHVEQAFKLFQQMQQEGLKPDKITVVNILNACAIVEALALGKLIHAYMVDGGIRSNVVVETALVNMYGKCGRIDEAVMMFKKMPERDLISWSAIIAAYAQHGFSERVFTSFQQMHQEGVKPDLIILVSILNAFGDPNALGVGRLVHAYIIDGGFESDVVCGTALVKMYLKCGGIEDARRTFDQMPERNLDSWNAMIGGYARDSHAEAAFKLFHQMQQEGVQPDKNTFVSIFNACASGKALAQGKMLHAEIPSGFESDIVVGNALVNMYGKCGSIEDACRIFNKMLERDVVSWTAMIAAYAQHGHCKEALKIFEHMQQEGVKPNEITLTSVLNACSHAGFVDEGLYYFNSMSEDYGISQTLEHYNCMVDLLGRAGLLDEAENLINKMPFQPDAVVWMTLLGCCRMHGCIDQGKRAAEHALQLDPLLHSAYVVLANIYAAAGRWNDVLEVRKLMEDMAVENQPGGNRIKVNFSL